MIKELQRISEMLLNFDSKKNGAAFSGQDIEDLKNILNSSLLIKDCLSQLQERGSTVSLRDEDEHIRILMSMHQEFSQIIDMLDQLHNLMSKVIC